MKVRGRVEREIRESGLRGLIVRPSFITGADRQEPRPTERAAALVADGILRVAGLLGATTVRQRFRARTAGELADGIVALALLPATGVRIVDGVDLDAGKEPR